MNKKTRWLHCWSIVFFFCALFQAAPSLAADAPVPPVADAPKEPNPEEQISEQPESPRPTPSPAPPKEKRKNARPAKPAESAKPAEAAQSAHHVDVRVSGVQHQLNSEALDNYTTYEGIDTVRHLPGIEVEVTDGKTPNLGTGLHLSAFQKKADAIDGTLNYTRGTYLNLSLLLRGWLINTPVFRWDVSGSLGVGWASVETDKPGRLAKYHAGPNNLAIPARLGTAFAVGYKYVFLVVGGGYEWGRFAHFDIQKDPSAREPDSMAVNGGYVTAGIELAL